MTTGTPLRFVERPMRFWSVGWDVDRGVTDADQEATLLARIARRDATAFETLYDRYSRPVYSLAVRMLGNPQAAQEVAQEIFLHIWRGAGQPTAGCTAMSQDHLLRVLNWLDPNREPRLVQSLSAW